MVNELLLNYVRGGFQVAKKSLCNSVDFCGAEFKVEPEDP